MYTLTSREFQGKSPQIDEEAFIAPQVFLSGDVRVGKYSSLWPCVVARGDVNYISVGECSNVQDLVCLHVADDYPCIIGDYVTIFRDGKLVADAAVKDIDVPWIVKQMVGEGKSYPKRDVAVDWSKTQKVLQVKDLTLPKSGGGYLLNKVSFDLHEGEVLGIYGLLGAGRTEIFECIMGMRPTHTGEVYLNGEKIEIGSVPEQIKKGFAWLPEDRQRDGLVQTMSIDKNIALSNVEDYTNAFGLIDKKRESAATEDMIKDVHIKVADKELPILSLSGGNQQKVVFAKGALTKPKIMLLDEPSRGIDIGAKTEIFNLIYQYAKKGVSLLVVSSELEEIIAIADRIIVLSNGIKTAELTGSDITQDNLVKASYMGHKAQ